MDTGRIDEAMRESAALRRRRDELEETQHWVHHVVDLASGTVLTDELARPVAPVSRAERLSRLGLRFDSSIFGGPSTRLTPRRPYQATPEAWLEPWNPDRCLPDRDDVILWQLPRVAPPGLEAVRHELDVVFTESPPDPCVVTFAFGAVAWEGTVGHVLVESLYGSGRVPVGDAYAAHTLDVFPRGLAGRLLHVRMVLEAGVHLLWLTAVTLSGTLAPAHSGTF